MQSLNAAAQAGNIDALYALIREDACLLKCIDEVPFVDTPLHVAASSGHTSFAMEMVNLIPSYARKLNQDGFSPLHLALKNEKTDLVHRLVDHDKDLIRVKGKYGMTPFHYTVEQGNLSLLVEFLSACHHCITDLTIQGETALHLALKNKKTEAFKVLVGWLRRFTNKGARDLERRILNRRDDRGNTVLHIAAYEGDANVVRLLSNSWLVAVHTKNVDNLTALNIATQSNNTEIIKILRLDPISKFFILRVKHKTLADELKPEISFADKIRIYINRGRERLSNDTQNALLVVFTVILVTSYDTALSPPGGIWQDQRDSNTTIPRLGRVSVDPNSNTKVLYQ